ncbi:MAG: PDDEXK nuclease domain-containing protein [Veillonellaceae bacterium]|nr:PDDEXK nuclease domain-containing protein [Veillonellaceae bacterium]
MYEIIDSNIYEQIKEILDEARAQVYHSANSAMVKAYWSIGKKIYEACNENDRAEYGKALLQQLSKKLTDDFGKGFTPANLRNMRQFYTIFPNCNALRSELSWTQYRLLMRVGNDSIREFYIEECIKSNWSSRQLERQINSFYYERLISSRDKEPVRKEALTTASGKCAKDFIHDPYVLEFLGLEQQESFLEKELEQTLIDNLQKFLLEMGRGFSFVARQKHIDMDGQHFYIDLVFYNYILKCFVLIDLKTGELTHQDVGQMDSYVRIYDDIQKGDDDNPTIGVILCSAKNKAIAKYSVLSESRQIFASKYLLTLPSETELQKYIEEERERIEERELLK